MKETNKRTREEISALYVNAGEWNNAQFKKKMKIKIFTDFQFMIFITQTLSRWKVDEQLAYYQKSQLTS